MAITTHTTEYDVKMVMDTKQTQAMLDGLNKTLNITEGMVKDLTRTLGKFHKMYVKSLDTQARQQAAIIKMTKEQLRTKVQLSTLDTKSGKVRKDLLKLVKLQVRAEDSRLRVEKGITAEKEKQSRIPILPPQRVQRVSSTPSGNSAMSLGTDEHTGLLATTKRAMQTIPAFYTTFAAMQGVGALFSGAIEQAHLFDTTLRMLSAVTGESTAKTKELTHQVMQLGDVYGGDMADIAETVNELSRAGIKLQDVVKSTEITAQLSMITGDTIQSAASAIISYNQVYAKSNDKVMYSVTELGDKLAYMANASRLTTQDIGTLSNYALAAAKSVGLTVDVVGGLSIAFSNAGNSASTIGTQIRRFTNTLHSNSTSVKEFYKATGTNRTALLQNLQKSKDGTREGIVKSNEAFIAFVHNVQKLSRTDYANAIKGMSVLDNQFFNQLRNNGDEIVNALQTSFSDLAGELDKTGVAVGSMERQWQALWNSVKNGSSGAGGAVSQFAYNSVVATVNSIATIKDLLLSGDALFGNTSRFDAIRARNGLAKTRMAQQNIADIEDKKELEITSQLLLVEEKIWVTKLKQAELGHEHKKLSEDEAAALAVNLAKYTALTKKAKEYKDTGATFGFSKIDKDLRVALDLIEKQYEARKLINASNKSGDSLQTEYLKVHQEINREATKELNTKILLRNIDRKRVRALSAYSRAVKEQAKLGGNVDTGAYTSSMAGVLGRQSQASNEYANHQLVSQNILLTDRNKLNVSNLMELRDTEQTLLKQGKILEAQKVSVKVTSELYQERENALANIERLKQKDPESDQIAFLEQQLASLNELITATGMSNRVYNQVSATLQAIRKQTLDWENAQRKVSLEVSKTFNALDVAAGKLSPYTAKVLNLQDILQSANDKLVSLQAANSGTNKEALAIVSQENNIRKASLALMQEGSKINLTLLTQDQARQAAIVSSMQTSATGFAKEKNHIEALKQNIQDLVVQRNAVADNAEKTRVIDDKILAVSSQLNAAYSGLANSTLQWANNMQQALSASKNIASGFQVAYGNMGTVQQQTLQKQNEILDAQLAYDNVVKSGLTGKDLELALKRADNVVQQKKLELLQLGIKYSDKEAKQNKQLILSTQALNAVKSGKDSKLAAVEEAQTKLRFARQELADAQKNNKDVLAAKIKVTDAEKELVQATVKVNEDAAKASAKAWKDAAKDAADEWKKTFGIFESGINGILHGNIFDSIGSTLSKLGDQMLKPTIDKWAAGLTTAWTGIVKPQGGFGAEMAKTVSDSITNGIQQGLTPKLASKIATKDFKTTLTKGLQPDVVEWFNAFKQYAARHGESIRIAPQGGFRTAEQQKAIYNRNTPEQWLTSKDGYIKKSVHQYGRAMDIISTAGYKAVKANTHIAKLMRSFSKVNSASERFLSMAKDPNHVEINRNGVKTYKKNGEALAKSFSKHMPSAGKQLAAPLLKEGEGQSGNLLGGFGLNLAGMFISALPSILGSLFGHKVTEAERKAATGQTDFSGDNFASVMTAFNNSQYKLLEYTQKQNMHLRSMDSNFLTVARALSPDGAGLTSMSPSGANFASKQSNVLFGLFSSTTQLISSGMNLVVKDFATGFEKIQTYYTQQKDKSYLFGLFSSSSISTSFTDVDPQTAKLFNTALQGGYDSILQAAVSLGFDKEKTIKALNSANLTIGKDGKIDMKGLSPEQQSERLKQAFGEMFSGVVSQLGSISTITDQYTEGMENQYETLLKIATINDQVTAGLKSIGISFSDITVVTEKLHKRFFGLSTRMVKVFSTYTATQQRLDMITGAAFGEDMNTGAKNFQQGINDYYANFMTTEEQYKSSFSQIQGYLHGIGVEAKQFDDPEKMKEWWKNLINGWDHSTKASNEAFGQLLTMSGQYSQLISLEERLSKTRADGTKSLLDLYTGQYSPLRMAEKTAFANNVYRNDTTDPLNTSKRALELAYKSARTDEDYQKEFLQYQKELIKQGADTSLKDIKDEMLESRKIQTEMRDEMHELRLSNERIVELQKGRA